MKKTDIAVVAIAILVVFWFCNLFHNKTKQSSTTSQPNYSDFGYDSHLHAPKWASNQVFTLSYPEMIPTEWPGLMALWGQKDAGKSAGYKSRFPVYLMQLRYEPFDDLKDMPIGLERRPKQMRLNLRADVRSYPSEFAGLELFDFPDDESVVHEKNVYKIDYSKRHTEISYINDKNIPYDVYTTCTGFDCEAEVYSERTQFRYALRFPSEGIAHLYDFRSLRSVNCFVVST